jgi:hypothetical protein
MRTIFTEENGDLQTAPKDSPNISEGFGDENEQIVKYPKRLRLRGKGTSGHLSWLAGRTEIQVPQSPGRDFREVTQPPPRRRPAIPTMGGSQRLPADDAPPA